MLLILPVTISDFTWPSVQLSFAFFSPYFCESITVCKLSQFKAGYFVNDRTVTVSEGAVDGGNGTHGPYNHGVSQNN